jgi:cobalt-precorrin-5B (C1)-methyltransferase
MSELQQGYTTGSCAAAATKAAALLLCRGLVSRSVEVSLPDGQRVAFPVVQLDATRAGALAAVRKNGGDDPDITHGLLVFSALELRADSVLRFAAGDGVGTVTRPGLSVPPGEPAINPGPRRMIEAALREVTGAGALVTISIPGGRELATKTFNPRLGIEGGLSVLGTSGRVRPFSNEAMRAALLCGLDVAVASGVDAPVFVPGNIGEKAARRHLRVSGVQVVDVGNEWGVLLDRARDYGVRRLLALGHPGKLAKLWMDQWDTHSSRSPAAVGPLAAYAAGLFGEAAPDSPTVEGVFMGLPPERRARLATALCRGIQQKIAERLGGHTGVAVALVNMAGDWLGECGDLTVWR